MKKIFRSPFFILIGFVLFLFLKKDLLSWLNMMSIKKAKYTYDEIKDVFVKKLSSYPLSFRKDIERLYRLETADFKSSQFLKCFSPGQVAFSTVFPYGWSNLKVFVEDNNLDTSLFSVVKFRLSYIRYPNLESAVSFVAWHLWHYKNGDVTRWYSNRKVDQLEYRKKLDSVKSRFF